MPGKGHNEAPDSSDPSNDSVSGTEVDLPSADTVPDKSQEGRRIAFWGRPKKPAEQGRKKTTGSDKNASQRERSQEKSDGGLLFFPRRVEQTDDSLRKDANFDLDRGVWEKQQDGAQWTAGPANSEASEYRSDNSPWIANDEFKYNPDFQSEWQKAEQAAWLDPESGVRDDRWDDAQLKGDQERALERANERARIQERLRNNKIEMPEAPQKSWRSKSFTEAAGDKPDALKRTSYEEYAQAFRDASPIPESTFQQTNNTQEKLSFDSALQKNAHAELRAASPSTQPAGDSTSQAAAKGPPLAPPLNAAPSQFAEAGRFSKTDASGRTHDPVPGDPSSPVSYVVSSAARAAYVQDAEAPAKKTASAKVSIDSTRGANETRNWYLSKLKARSKNSSAVSPANRKREILSQITPGSSSLSSATVILGVSLLLCVAACVCQALNMPSVAQVLPGAAALGIAIGAFMVFQSEQRFRKLNKELDKKTGAETKELDELGLIEYLLKLQEYELAELREREQTFLDFTDEKLCTLDNRLCIIYLNDALLKSSGFVRDDVLGKPFTDFFAVEERERVLKSISDARSSGKELTFEVGLRRRDVSALEMKWQVEYSESADCYFCSARDISAQRAGERTQRQFLGFLDEELKLPLTAVQGALSMLRIGAYGTLPEQVLIRAGSIEKTTAQLIRLVSDLVDLERIDTGKMVLRIDDFPISVITEQAVEAVQPMADQKHISLHVKNNRSRLTADSERLLRVMVNLLSAGIYLSFEHTSLLVDIEESEAAVQIQISCQGRSLSPAEQNKLFDRSRSASLGDATMSSAVIVAMSVSKGIIEKHGGTLSLQSNDGKGMMIVCLLPKTQRQGIQGSQFG